MKQQKLAFFSFRPPLIWNQILLRKNEPLSYIPTGATYGRTKFGDDLSTYAVKRKSLQERIQGQFTP